MKFVGGWLLSPCGSGGPRTGTAARKRRAPERALLVAAALWGLTGGGLLAQEGGGTGHLTLSDARSLARSSHPAIEAARQTVLAATGFENQAGAFTNPTLSFSREQTSTGGGTNWENTAMVAQPIEIGGQRGARRAGARSRREAAAAHLAATESRIDFEVGRAYALVVAATHRLVLTTEAAEIFSNAREMGFERLAAGDISGYENRRIALEAGRYAVLQAEMTLALHDARLSLAALIAPSEDSISALAAGMVLVDSITPASIDIPLDSLIALAFRHRPELQAAGFELEASRADARLVSREAFPTPTLALGFRNERGAGDPVAASGFTLQVAFPLPLWDRRQGASVAARAVSQRADARLDELRRSVAMEVERAWRMFVAATGQLDALRPLLGPDARLALRAAAAAYREGEIPLIEWLDAVRAYHEAESSFTSLQADQVIRLLTLERATGVAPVGGTER